MTGDQIEHFKAEKQKATFTIQDDDGNAVDLTAADVVDAHLEVHTRQQVIGEGSKLYSKTADTLKSDGTAAFIVNKADTENQSTGNYLYTVWIEYTGGETYVAEIGLYHLKARIDR